ncbi:MAG: NADH-quinone oxidoreductase subunit J [Gemmatimonadetes bacterium]|nr:NADH-quinone oxidoreductase subunit J [Gemmatimonadota bacterium]
MMTQLLWWIFASLSIGGAIGMVTRKNPIASLLFLVLTLFNTAAIFVLLGAHFIAAIQVLVYAGAIMVLFLFVIMLLNLGHAYRSDIRGGVWLVVGFAAAGVLGYAVSRAFTGEPALLEPRGAAAAEAAVQELNAVGAIAFPLFRDYLVPFELTSVLLLVAIVGAVLLAKRRV